MNCAGGYGIQCGRASYWHQPRAHPENCWLDGLRLEAKGTSTDQPVWPCWDSVYRSAFERPKAVLGRQSETLAGAVLWVLPNPSGLNAHYQVQDFSHLFRELRLSIIS